MNYAKYILISHISSLKKEIDLLEKEGNYIIENTPEFLQYNKNEIINVLSELKIKQEDLINALKLLNKQPSYDKRRKN